ncbi:MAG: DinB family protein [Pseudomonadota bacterium]
MKGSAEVLAQTLDLSRQLTQRYINRIINGDLKKQIVVGDIKLNCAHWIIAHLTWSENMLILLGCGGSPVKKEWLNLFQIGSTAEPQDNWPSIEIVLNDMKEIHESTLQHILSLTDTALEEPNLTPIHFNGDKSKRVIIQHAIRHEAMHCGHLSWLCKLQGLK